MMKYLYTHHTHLNGQPKYDYTMNAYTHELKY